MSELRPLTSIEDLETALAESTERPVLLFKHSHTCGISAMAFEAIEAHLADRPFPICYGLVTVQTDRHISDEITKRLGVRHETPQVILVRDGEVRWSASHFHVNAKEVEEALRQVSEP
jgi:bacillithiol system protein YtxJ